jgi:hypothetical protein
VNPAAGLKPWIPGLQVWYGLYTRSWWAFVPGRPDRLIEAASPEHLVQRLLPLAGRQAMRSRW